MNFLKSMLFIFLALLCNTIKAQIVMDSVLILDYKYSRWIGDHSGFPPTYIKINGLNTVTLDAADKRIKKSGKYGLSYFNENYTVRNPIYLVAIKIYFPKDSIIKFSVKAKNYYRRKNFAIDTVLVIDATVPRPLYFCGLPRRICYNQFKSCPIIFTITNEDIVNCTKPRKRKKRIKVFEKKIRYTYNTVTKEFADKW